jgi:hypothetical protein
MFESCPESSLRFMMDVMTRSMMIRAIHESIKIAVTMWPKHVEVAKEQARMGLERYMLHEEAEQGGLVADIEHRRM